MLSRYGVLLVVCLSLLAADVKVATEAYAQTGAGLVARPQRYGFGFGKNKVRYRDFDWRIYHSPHFDVYYYEGEEDLLEKVVSFAESAYDRLSREFDFQITEPTPLIFYETHAAFEQNNIILNFIPEGVGAFATPNRFRMVLPVDMPDDELMQLIAHELTHIFQYHILFGGSLGRTLTASAAQWFMEGMASYMAEDESARDKMYLRDGVVNDRIPPVSRWNGGGFYAYRIGHAVFDFIEERWGEEGFRDFVYEVRNTIGGSMARAIERTFRMDPEEFDAEFRRWLRKKYLPELIETGEPGDFGRPFRDRRGRPTQDTSPVASPSGDLVAALFNEFGEVDIKLIDAENRVPIENLTKGFNHDFRYLVGQEQSLDRQGGSDLAFSPDGNHVAVLARREGGRSLYLVDVLDGGFDRRIDLPDTGQQIGLAWHPDGRRIAFAAWHDTDFDIFTVDIETEEVVNVTDDSLHNVSPAFSPDGRWLFYSSVVGDGYAKLFRLDLTDPAQRFQLTTGESNEFDPVYSTVEDRIYFTSDRSGTNNIWSLDLDSGELRQWTDAVTGTFQPTVLAEPEEGEERLVYTAFWKGRFQLYVTDIEEPVGDPEIFDLAEEPAVPEELPGFEPDIQVAINEENDEKYGGFKLFFEDAGSTVGVDDSGRLIGLVVVSLSDYLGDRRVTGAFASADSLSNFDVIYQDLSDRLQWQVHLFEDRTFLVFRDQRFAGFNREVDREQTFRQTGIMASIIYPLSFQVRAQVGAGYVLREIDIPFVDRQTGRIEFFEFFDDDFPAVEAALVGDSAVFAPWGAVSGRRWRIDGFYAPDLDESGTLMTSVDVDFRQYIPVTRRSNFAFRVFGGVSDGNRPTPVVFGGFDEFRNAEFNSFVGDRGFFANAEFRFPLIDELATPLLRFQGIRGVLFFDIGAAYYSDEEFEFLDSEEDRLRDGRAAFGYGVTIRMFGLDLNWDFAKEWDFEESIGDFRTSFWLGRRF